MADGGKEGVGGWVWVGAGRRECVCGGGGEGAVLGGMGVADLHVLHAASTRCSPAAALWAINHYR